MPIGNGGRQAQRGHVGPHSLSRLVSVTKTKAHRTVAAATLAGDQEAYWGNWLADRYAKAAAAEHRCSKERLAARSSSSMEGQCPPSLSGLAQWLPPGRSKHPDGEAQPASRKRVAHCLRWQPGRTPWACAKCYDDHSPDRATDLQNVGNTKPIHNQYKTNTTQRERFLGPRAEIWALRRG
jgi:hypothetical protein